MNFKKIYLLQRKENYYCFLLNGNRFFLLLNKIWKNLENSEIKQSNTVIEES